MHACMYVCVYELFVCIAMYQYVCIYVCMYVYVYVYMQRYTCNVVSANTRLTHLCVTELDVYPCVRA